VSGGILVALDGSAAAEAALPYAQALARAQRRRLLLVRAVDVVGGASVDRTALHGAEAYLAAVVGRFMTGMAVEAVTFAGQPKEAILAEARLRRVGLIVLAVDSRRPAWRALGSATTQAVLADAEVPTLFVPVRSDSMSTTLPIQSRRILVPLDGSRFAEAALPLGISLARSLGIGVLLLYCAAPVAAVTAPAARSSDAVGRGPAFGATEGGAYLAAQQARLGRQDPAIPVTITVRQGAAGEQIVRAALEHNALLVTMATHGGSGNQGALLGSVAANVLQQAVVPQLLIRPPGVETTPTVHAA